ncbi:MAG: FAD binding domain-containing protein [Anaerolineae bacterium]|nr:FAD binding domain-containing protein [Anaerolineae bacterium]
MTEHVHRHDMTNSHILVHEFAYAEPASLEEAVTLLQAYGSAARLIAGGTSLLVEMKQERRRFDCLIDVHRLPELAGVAAGADALYAGALTPIRALLEAPVVQARYAALADACAAFGSTQIQMMGTLGGNVCNGSPASDTVPALLALDAELVLVGPGGQRTLPLSDFLLGPGKTALADGEVLTTVRLPTPQPGTGSAFIKISRVRADLAKASAAAVLVREGERVVGCRIALGSVAPTVVRAPAAEAALVGQTFSAELALEAGNLAAQAVSPIDDVRSTAWYRREVIKALVHDALLAAWERAGQPAQGTADLLPDPAPAQTRSLRVGADETHTIELTVNGRLHKLAVAPNELLLNVIRERLLLTGSKYGCGVGECGACTVLLDGRPTLACLVLALSADGSEVLTVEGLQGPHGELHPLQQAFIDEAAFQCGYCTPGMLMMSESLLSRIPQPSEDDVRDYLKGNRCRCTGFASIVRAVLACVEE